jgi:hypothetical protein
MPAAGPGVEGFRAGNRVFASSGLGGFAVLLENIAVVGLHWGAQLQHQPELVEETFTRLREAVVAGRVGR